MVHFPHEKRSGRIIQGFAGFRIAKKLQRLKSKIKEWNKKCLAKLKHTKFIVYGIGGLGFGAGRKRAEST